MESRRDREITLDPNHLWTQRGGPTRSGEERGRPPGEGGREVIEAVGTEESRECDNPNYYQPDYRTQVGDEARGMA